MSLAAAPDHRKSTVYYNVTGGTVAIRACSPSLIRCSDAVHFTASDVCRAVPLLQAKWVHSSSNAPAHTASAGMPTKGLAGGGAASLASTAASRATLAKPVTGSSAWAAVDAELETAKAY